MKIFEVTVVTLGNQNKPEEHREEVIAGNIEEVCGLLERTIRDSMSVVTTVSVTESKRQPFET